MLYYRYISKGEKRWHIKIADIVWIEISVLVWLLVANAVISGAMLNASIAPFVVMMVNLSKKMNNMLAICNSI
jgi:hypothetical protein